MLIISILPVKKGFSLQSIDFNHHQGLYKKGMIKCLIWKRENFLIHVMSLVVVGNLSLEFVYI